MNPVSTQEPHLVCRPRFLGPWLTVSSTRRGAIHTIGCHWTLLLLLGGLTVRSSGGLAICPIGGLAIRPSWRLTICPSGGLSIRSGWGLTVSTGWRSSVSSWLTVHAISCGVLHRRTARLSWSSIFVFGKLDRLPNSMLCPFYARALKHDENILLSTGLSCSAQAYVTRLTLITDYKAIAKNDPR